MNAVTLRRFARGDAPWLDTWFAVAADRVGYDLVDLDAPGVSLLARLESEPSLMARVIERDGDRAGVIVCRAGDQSRGRAIIEIVATPPDSARRGSGMIAAAAIEDELRTVGAHEVFAPASAAHGIAVYFWIRLGYRPLQRTEWPCERAGVAWLMRSI